MWPSSDQNTAHRRISSADHASKRGMSAWRHNADTGEKDNWYRGLECLSAEFESCEIKNECQFLGEMCNVLISVLWSVSVRETSDWAGRRRPDTAAHWWRGS